MVGPPGVGKSRLAAELLSRQRPVPVADLDIEAIGERRCVVLLDGCEQDIDEYARLATELLTQCPNVRIVATGREALLVPGEVRFPVGPLPPADAVALFRHDTAPDVAERICAQLDGLPLAIEAAARLRPSPAELLPAVLDDQRLRAAIDRGHDGLTPRERRVFRTLAMLPGWFDLRTAGAVCDLDPTRCAATVAALVAKSLVVADDGRYRLLAPIREYARERLAAAGEVAVTELRMVHGLSVIAREFTEPVFTPAGRHEQLIGLVDLLEFAADSAARLGRPVLPLVTTLAICLWINGETARGLTLLKDTLDHADADPHDRCVALTHAGWLASADGDRDEALVLAERAVEVAVSTGERHLLGRSLNVLAAVHLARGELASARATYEVCLDQLDAPMDKATCLHNLAWAVLQDGDRELADELVNRALPIYRLYAEPPKLPALLHTAGTVAVLRGDLARAESLFTEGLRSAPDNVYETPYLVEGLAVVAARTERPERALRLVGGATTLRTTDDPRWAPMVRAAEDLARQVVHAPTAHAAVAGGASLERDQIIAYAVHDEWLLPTESDSPLTAREREIAALVARGDTNRQIARIVGVSERTVEAHLARIREKLGLRTRTQVVAWSMSVGA
ncbi:hypothetical protein Lesp02_29430 [Lentzea sp. NBRC 105346]|nr:hypothetical protein Lesp02_29430 [Lentzea sp. NBRC 105346]